MFSAKGDANAEHLHVDWIEKDGSQWTKTVLLSTEWEQYVLRPEDFRYLWGGNGRGGAGDTLKLEAAEKVSFGNSLRYRKLRAWEAADLGGAFWH